MPDSIPDFISGESHRTDLLKNRPFEIRPGTDADQLALHKILLDAVWDLAWRIGIQDGERFASEEEQEADLARWQPILDHLNATGNQFWVAEQAGKPLGYARSIVRDGVRELTEFFVSPEVQTSGIGRALLARAMPPGARRTYIMSTMDLRAQARYHKLGVYQSVRSTCVMAFPHRWARPSSPRP